MSARIFSLSTAFPNQFTPTETAPGAQWMRSFQQQAPYLPEYKKTPFNNLQFSGKYATKNECYNEQLLSIKSRCYNERGGILSANVARTCAWRVRPTHFD